MNLKSEFMWKIDMLPSYRKKMAPSRAHEPKPAVHRLCAEVPCNYNSCRPAAALQSIFVSCTLLPPFFILDQ